MLTETLFLSKHMRQGQRLASRETAIHIWEVERLEDKHYLHVDFSGIEAQDISREFITEFFRLDRADGCKVWLLPIHYSDDLAKLLAGCIATLKQKRASSHKEGFIKAQLHFERGGPQSL